MADDTYFAPVEGRDLHVEHQAQWCAASLRYFERDGAFTQLVQAMTRLSVPNELAAVCSGQDTDRAVLLAWRGPTETTLLTRDASLLELLQTSAAQLADGCVIDQRGGLLVMRARGQAVDALVARKAGHGSMPALGESRRARFAEVSVLIVKLVPEEILLVVDRIYAPHVMDSIRVTAADLAIPLHG